MSTINPFLIGFESLFDKANSMINESSYPPYNVIKISDEAKADQPEGWEYWDYEIHLAVAGFKENEIKVYREGNVLTISGESKEKPEDGFIYIHKGISSRKFKKQFTLSENVKVLERGVGFDEGILKICLENIEPKPGIEYYEVY
jgi:molecular chaperone IbpA